MSYDSTNDLTEYDKQFDAAPAPEYETISDGKYQVVVDKVEITKGKTSGNPLLKWTLKILGPKNINQRLWTYHILSNPTSLKWLKKDLNLCEVHLNKLSDLPQNLEQLLDIQLEVTVRNRNENQNVYFNRRLNDAEVPGTGNDDLPF